MTTRRLVTILALILVIAPASYATIGGLALMKVETGPRPSGLGGAFTGVAGDVFSSAYNPAGSATVSNFNASFGHIEYWDKIRIESGYFASPLKGRWFIHGGIRYATLGDIQVRGEVPTTEPMATADANDASFKGGVSYAVSDRVRAGVSAGWFMEKIEAWQGSSFNIDLGLQARATDRLDLGASALNVGSKFSLSKNGAGESREISLPTMYRAGAAYHYKKYLGVADFVILDDQAHFHIGAEAKLHELLAVRAGYMTNYDSKNLTAGASFIYHNLGIDYAFVPYSNDLGSVHLFGLTIRL